VVDPSCEAPQAKNAMPSMLASATCRRHSIPGALRACARAGVTSLASRLVALTKPARVRADRPGATLPVEEKHEFAANVRVRPPVAHLVGLFRREARSALMRSPRLASSC